mmetsp:Transcript_10952/g.20876  ORF Transcript_10952/g.20876 Transcript_10952/m.20876 type:complete len:201 (+) Transcript_10952:268-870(+)
MFLSTHWRQNMWRHRVRITCLSRSLQTLQANLLFRTFTCVSICSIVNSELALFRNRPPEVVLTAAAAAAACFVASAASFFATASVSNRRVFSPAALVDSRVSSSQRSRTVLRSFTKDKAFAFDCDKRPSICSFSICKDSTFVFAFLSSSSACSFSRKASSCTLSFALAARRAASAICSAPFTLFPNISFSCVNCSVSCFR